MSYGKACDSCQIVEFVGWSAGWLSRRPYTRQFDFADFQSVNPAAPLPGDKVDLELDTAKITLDQILQNLSLIQRDDGRLMNGSSAKSSFRPGSASASAPRGVWATGTVYALE
jgi:hypothetical protein